MTLDHQIARLLDHHGLQAILHTIADQLDAPPVEFVEQAIHAAGTDALIRVVRHYDREISRYLAASSSGQAALAVLTALVEHIDHTTRTCRADHARAWRRLAQSDQLTTARRLTGANQ